MVPIKVLIRLKYLPIYYEDKIKVIRNTLIPTWFMMNRYLISSTFVITILYTLHVTVIENHLTYKTSHNLCNSNQTPAILYSKRNVVDEHPIIFLIFSWVLLLFGAIQIFLEMFWPKWPKTEQRNWHDFMTGKGLEEMVVIPDIQENESQDMVTTNNQENGLLNDILQNNESYC